MEASLRVLRACPCGSENVAACHRCLLPHVPAPLALEARRDAAIDLLGQILERWEPRPIETIKRIVVGSHDTPIEMRFRALLVRWAKSKGAAVSTQATSHGDSVKISFPSALGDSQWALAPQVKLRGVQPDFLLTCADHEVPRIAVFCDSLRWHSSPQTNRLAEDAGNRADLRDQDYLVWAVTHHDLDTFAAALDGRLAAPPGWCGESLRVTFVQVAQKMAAPGSVKLEVLLRDPVSMLTEFLLRPSRKAWASPAHSLAVAMSRGAATKKLDATALPALLCGELGGSSGTLPAGQTTVAIRRTVRGAVVVLEMHTLHDVRAWLAVDDRDEVMGSTEQSDAWRDWLWVGNLLQFLEPGRFQAHTYTTVGEASAAPAVGPLPRPWQDIADVSDGVVRALVLALAGDGLPLPEAGHELDDGEYLIDLAWPDRRVAVVADVDHDRDEWLVTHGWTVVPADEQAVRAALHTAGGR